jgi:hypothetical protein
MSPKLSIDQPGTYSIRVQGTLSERWAGYFEEMTLSVDTDADGHPLIVLTGRLPDQAAVQGVLQKLYNLGFPLISVEKIDQEVQDAG